MANKFAPKPEHQIGILDALKNAGFKFDHRGERLSIGLAGNSKGFQHVAQHTRTELPTHLDEAHAQALMKFLKPHHPATHDVRVSLKHTGTDHNKRAQEVRVEFQPKA